ncbi:MAG: glycogen/starch synthase [Flavobacteriales bacterium]|jgi:starch synthase|nr:glycogen/starch synthase [Flavobacteriales bacterium]
MKEKRVLYVSSEVSPYLPENELSKMSFEVPKMVHNKGGQIRIFMPHFGIINERRHQLHEVIRLSGMNLIINDLDMPLIIKVASIPRERMQVYFIDNDEYFKRKAIYKDENGDMFGDNDERCIFFARGVVETVKKLNWMPDVIHVSGWMASLLPLYLKTYYADEPLFKNSKIVTSLYNTNKFSSNLNGNLIDKLLFDDIAEDKLTSLKTPNFSNLLKIAIENSDAVVKGTEKLPKQIETYLETLDKPVLDYQPEDGFEEAYANFYTNHVF